MPEHIVGYIIIGLSIFVLGSGILLRWLWWGQWLNARAWGGRRVKWVEPWSAGLAGQLTVANQLIDRAIDNNDPMRIAVKRENLPDGDVTAAALKDFWVEVVPIGEIDTPSVPRGTTIKASAAGGTLAGGSIKTVRFLPFTRKVTVAQVIASNSGGFLIHEWAMHILPVQLGRGGDSHNSHGKTRLGFEDYARLESDMKAEYRRLM